MTSFHTLSSSSEYYDGFRKNRGTVHTLPRFDRSEISCYVRQKSYATPIAYGVAKLMRNIEQLHPIPCRLGRNMMQCEMVQ